MNKTLELRKMVIASLLLAFIILFGLTPLGMWNFGVVYITLMCIPVILGTLVLGQGYGMLLTIAFGTISLITGLRAPSALASPIYQRSPVLLAVLCYAPRLLVPLTTLLAKQLFVKNENDTKQLAIPCVVGSLTNTFFYLGLIPVLYIAIGFDNPTILSTLGGIVLAGGLPEAVACAIIVPAIIFALRKAKLLESKKKHK